MSMSLPICICKIVPCTCQDEDKPFEWRWDDTNLNPSTVLSTNKRDILFHKSFSTGTAAVRGTEPFTLNFHYYWEIRILTTLYGTDVMIGLGTDAVDLNFSRNRFCRMLGDDRNSWGYSYRGEVQHDGEFYTYGRFFDKDSVIGCHLDMCRGTLEYYHNRERLGIAFTGLKLHARRLYPIVCSTAAQSAIRLNCAIIIKPTLQFATLRKLKKREELQDVYKKAPPGLQRFLLQQFWWLIEPVPILNAEGILGLRYSSDEEEILVRQVQPRRHSRRKRKRSKKTNRRSVSEDAAFQQQSRLMDGPTYVDTLNLNRVLRSHTRNLLINPIKCERCSRTLTPRAGPRTRSQTSTTFCSDCDGN